MKQNGLKPTVEGYFDVWENVLRHLLGWNRDRVEAWARGARHLTDDTAGLDHEVPCYYIAPLLIPPEMMDGQSGQEIALLTRRVCFALERECGGEALDPMDEDYDWHAARRRVQKVIEAGLPKAAEGIRKFRGFYERFWRVAMREYFGWTEAETNLWMKQFSEEMKREDFYRDGPFGPVVSALIAEGAGDRHAHEGDSFLCEAAVERAIYVDYYDDEALARFDWAAARRRVAEALRGYSKAHGVAVRSKYSSEGGDGRK